MELGGFRLFLHLLPSPLHFLGFRRDIWNENLPLGPGDRSHPNHRDETWLQETQRWGSRCPPGTRDGLWLWCCRSLAQFCHWGEGPCSSSPTLQDAESDFLHRGWRKGAVWPSGFWTCLSNNSVADEIQVTVWFLVEHAYLTASLEHSSKQMPGWWWAELPEL